MRAVKTQDTLAHSHVNTQVYYGEWCELLNDRLFAVERFRGGRRRWRKAEVEMGGRGVEVKTSWKFGNRWPLYVTHAFMDGCVNACVTGQSACMSVFGGG